MTEGKANKMRTIDLSGLHRPDDKEQVHTVGMAVIDMPLDRIEMRAQPRTTMDDKAMSELMATIKEHGLRQPVSVRENPDKPGYYIVNEGHRRVVAHIRLGLQTVRAFVNNDFSVFGQVVENTAREDMTPMDIMRFIKTQIDAGLSKTEIARQLGKASPDITYYLSLDNMPDGIQKAYDQGLITSPRVVHELSLIYKNNPAEVNKLVNEHLKNEKPLIRRAATELKDRLDANKKAAQFEIIVTPSDGSSLEVELTSEDAEIPDFAEMKTAQLIEFAQEMWKLLSPGQIKKLNSRSA